MPTRGIRSTNERITHPPPLRLPRTYDAVPIKGGEELGLPGLALGPRGGHVSRRRHRQVAQRDAAVLRELQLVPAGHLGCGADGGAG